MALRYLCFKTWEQIAVDMGYSIQNAYKVYDRALENMVVKNDKILIKKVNWLLRR